jgi:hypothetical protein
VPTLQQQASYLAGAHPLRRQAFVPGAGLDEHCREDVYRPVWRVGAVILLYFNDLLKMRRWTFAASGI